MGIIKSKLKSESEAHYCAGQASCATKEQLGLKRRSSEPLFQWDDRHSEAIIEWATDFLSADYAQLIFSLLEPFVVKTIADINNYYPSLRRTMRPKSKPSFVCCPFWFEQWLMPYLSAHSTAYAKERIPQLCVHVTGAGGVGKTSISRRLTYDDFGSVYDPTIEDTDVVSVQLNETQSLSVTVSDTHETEFFQTAVDAWFRDTHVFLWVIDCSRHSPRSLREELARIWRNIQRQFEFRKPTELKPPIVIALNKADLVNEEKRDRLVDIVIPEMIRETDCEIGEVPIVVCSAKNGGNTQLLLKVVIKEMWAQSVLQIQF